MTLHACMHRHAAVALYACMHIPMPDGGLPLTLSPAPWCLRRLAGLCKALSCVRCCVDCVCYGCSVCGAVGSVYVCIPDCPCTCNPLTPMETACCCILRYLQQGAPCSARLTKYATLPCGPSALLPVLSVLLGSAQQSVVLVLPLHVSGQGPRHASRSPGLLTQRVCTSSRLPAVSCMWSFLDAP
jgi:hypothetical protein